MLKKNTFKIFSNNLRNFHSFKSILSENNKEILLKKYEKYLSKPFGVEEKDIKTIEKEFKKPWYKEYIGSSDSNERREKRKEIIKELNESGFKESYEFREKKGKNWIAPPWGFKGEKAKYFPNLNGYSITKPSNKVWLNSLLLRNITIVRLFTSPSGFSQVSSYFGNANSNSNKKGLFDNIKNVGDYQVFDIDIQQDNMKAFISRWFSISNLKKNILDNEKHHYFIIPKGGLESKIRESLRLDNIYTGYIYLIDRHGRIRWAACGESTPEEREGLWKVLGGLIRG